MRQITYAPVHGSKESVQCAGVDFAPGVAVTVTDEQAAELLRNRFFVDASTGTNPNFVCQRCGMEAHEDGALDPVLARVANDPIRKLVDADGQRVCSACPRDGEPPGATVVAADPPRYDAYEDDSQ